MLNKNEQKFAAPVDDGVNKTIVRIQIKKLKELKTTLEQDLLKKEQELEKGSLTGFRLWCIGICY